MIDNVLAMFSLLCFSAGHIAQTVVVAVVVVLAYVGVLLWGRLL